MQNVNAKIIAGVSKKTGKTFKAVQFSINTSQGIYLSPLCFPSNLEIALVEQAISPVADIYLSNVNNGDTSPEL